MASGGAVLGVRQPGWTVFQIQTPGGRYLKYRPPWGPSSRSIGHVRSRSGASQRGRRQVLTPETVRVHPRGGRRGPLARSLGRGDWRRRRRLEICFSETPRSLSLGRSCCCRQSRELRLPCSHGPLQVSIQTPNRPSLALWCPLLTEECSLIEQGRHGIAMPFVLRSPPSSGMLLMMTPALSVD